MVLGLVASIYTAHRLSRSTTEGRAKRGAVFAPYGFLMLLFAVINIYLFSMPMGMRM